MMVEGYMDVVSLRAHGVEGVVATLGTALTVEQARLAKRYAPEIWVGYDGDPAGRSAILRALDIFEAESIKARVLAFPNDQDPDDFIRANGIDGFNQLKPRDPIEYRMERAADAIDLSTEDGRTEYAIACCQILKKVVNPVELDVHVGRLSIQTGFSHDVLMRQVGVMVPVKVQTTKPRPTQKRLDEESEDQRAQHMLLALLANRLIAPETVSVDDFDDALYSALADSLLSGVMPAAALDKIDEDDRARAARALNIEVLPDERVALAEAEECLDTIRISRARREVERLRLQTQLESVDASSRRMLLGRIGELNQIIKQTKAK